MYAPPRACVSSLLTAERPRTGGDFVLHRGASQGHRDSARAQPPGNQPSISARALGVLCLWLSFPVWVQVPGSSPPLTALFPREAPGSPSFILTKFLKFTIFLPCVPAYLRPFRRHGEQPALPSSAACRGEAMAGMGGGNQHPHSKVHVWSVLPSREGAPGSESRSQSRHARRLLMSHSPDTGIATSHLELTPLISLMDFLIHQDPPCHFTSVYAVLGAGVNTAS